MSFPGKKTLNAHDDENDLCLDVNERDSVGIPMYVNVGVDVDADSGDNDICVGPLPNNDDGVVVIKIILYSPPLTR